MIEFIWECLVRWDGAPVIRWDGAPAIQVLLRSDADGALAGKGPTS